MPAGIVSHGCGIRSALDTSRPVLVSAGRQHLRCPATFIATGVGSIWRLSAGVGIALSLLRQVRIWTCI